jgi:endonuclease YncB( thermonuclease family)
MSCFDERLHRAKSNEAPLDNLGPVAAVAEWANRQPMTWTGKASVVVDGTIEIGGARIRLWGIDAPESNQICRAKTASSIHVAGDA